MPAWIATCHASGGSFRSLPIAMIMATLSRWSEFSFAASPAPLPAGPDVMGPRLALHVSDAPIALAWSAAWSCDTTWVTALTPATATVTTTTRPPTITALFISAPPRRLRRPAVLDRSLRKLRSCQLTCS